MTNPEGRLAELGIELPEPAQPGGNYVSARRHGDTLYLSGHGAAEPLGKVGTDLTLEQGYEAARQTGLLLLAALRAELGSLDEVKSIVKLLGMVNCAPGFNNTPGVINGCSDLLVEVFGEEIGRGARSAVGMAELPFDIPVEIELIAAV
jgi:enamine deaminase RidA (YjgF/YER057c/UK114 family)